MPTTCGFPNCKFRSRYRGQEDNRHFYRIPKRPLVLRQGWLNAIGRTEETVVSQKVFFVMGHEQEEGDEDEYTSEVNIYVEKGDFSAENEKKTK
uniref:THAP-type domain-containing protein n=1 Tax=Syphacia muris TaxID=451379 RepID=A0A0N5ABW3_9BILA